MLAIIDGDIVAFRCAFSAEGEEEWIARSRTDKMIQEILDDTGSDEYVIYLSGKGNFRYIVFPEYKANRIGAARPKWEKETKEHLHRKWGAEWTTGCEADDLIGVTGRQKINRSIICSIDKDLDQIPGWHFNFVKKEKYYVDEIQSIRFFYYQLLIGDSADGIKGCQGIGPKKAERLLSKGENEEDWFNLVRAAYDNDLEMDMNGKCLKIWQEMNEDWSIENQTAKFKKQGEENAVSD